MRRLRKLGAIFCILLLLTACGIPMPIEDADLTDKTESTDNISLSRIPEYSGEPYVVINDNEPDFTEADMTEESYESYSGLDWEKRCGAAMASIGKDLMPTEERGSIGQVKPSGWQTVKYDNVEGKYLYNRCHLIGFQLTGENANERNLITGTRYMNTEGMLPFENMVADYIKETGNHVLYRVTPIFEGDNLVASGVQMEAKSVEDDGDGICFNVYAYNVQPGIEIDYATGDSKLAEVSEEDEGEIVTYILNTNNRKFHEENCSSVTDMKEQNKQVYKGTRENLTAQGYEPCGRCNP
ncbi:MAG: DNA/RNA non-specific endonuclease [Tyzzerella sp.]|nr:DNA/RNA non-specific endonuclease [Tyzzerella sp.]